MIGIKPLPAPLKTFDLSVLLATGFGSGRILPAPGTWGSLAAWVVGLGILMTDGGKAILLLAMIAYFFAGMWAVEQIETKTGTHDDNMIVVDEWVGVWLAMLLTTPDPILFFLCLFLFRVFDVLKPWPISWMDERIPGAFGVIVDDMAAGLATAACVWVIGLWIL